MRCGKYYASLLLLLLVTLPSHGAINSTVLVSTDWLEKHLRDRQVTIFEAGDRTTFEAEHIKGARFAPLSELVITRGDTPNELPDPIALEKTLRAAGLPKRGRIVIYARDPIIAARIFFTLDYAGRGTDIALLDGGYAKWTAEKRPVVSGAPVTAAGDFEVSARPEVIVRHTAMMVLAECAEAMPENIVLVDARPAEAYGQGHIGCALNIPWNENLTGGATPVFRSREDLASLYAASGVGKDASIAAYCRTGMQASVTYFVLRYLGRDVHLYDGSWAEWTAAQTGP